MVEADLEMEFLDEDADLIQHCLRTTTSNINNQPVPNSPLLVERRPKSKIKRFKKEQEDKDDDYDPRKDEDFLPRKRKIPMGNKILRVKDEKPMTLRVTPSPPVRMVAPHHRTKYSTPVLVPDFEDSLCLPINVKKDSENVTKIKLWNSKCVKAYTRLEEPKLPELTKEGVKTTNKTMMVIRKMKNDIEGNYNNIITIDTEATNSLGMRKQENFRGVLPQFVEKKLNIKYSEPKNKKRYITRNTVLLTVDDKNDKAMSVYEPIKKMFTTFKMVQKCLIRSGEQEKKNCLEENTKKRMCTPCFQNNWKDKGLLISKKEISCMLCHKMVDAHKMVSHLDTHDGQFLDEHREELKSSLFKYMEQQYECKVCQKVLGSKAALYKHLEVHQGMITFECEAGKHSAR